MARVMVVEDDDVTRLMLESGLRAAGHWVQTAASMAEAEALVEWAGHPDVLVTDMFMPGGSGLNLVAALRENPAGATVPVIFLSGRALPGDVEAGRALGATYLTKPLSMPSLTAAIDEAVAAGAVAVETTARARLDDLGGAESPDERELFVQLLTLFLQQAPDQVDALEEALAAGNAGAVERGAHRLAGGAAHLGADGLARLCAGLETCARSGQLPDAGPVRVALRRELTTTRRVFTGLVRELRGRSAAEAAAAPAGPA